MKILILKPSSLGDVIHALPVLRLLKRHLPHSEIHWWIESGLAPLLEGDPDLAGLVRFDRRRWAAPRNWVRLLESVRWVRRQQFDIVLDLQCLARSSVFAWLANGKLSVGLDEPREGARGFYDIIARRPFFYTHAVDRYLAVLPLLGVPIDSSFQWLPCRPEAASSIRKKWPVDQSRWVVLQPGARWVNKRWPAEHFAALVRLIAGAYPDLRFAVLGGFEEQPLAQIICRADSKRCLDLTGQLSLPEMVEWLRACELMVTNDTGPMHVAAALERPVVGLFGPTEPFRTGPYGQVQNAVQLDLPCVPCLKSRCRYFKPFECLRALSPAAVFSAVQRRLTHTREPSPGCQ